MLLCTKFFPLVELVVHELLMQPHAHHRPRVRGFLRQEVALQGLQHGGSQVLATTRQKVERIGNMLPKRLNFLIEKADRLSRLVEGVREGREWVGAAQERLAKWEAQVKLRQRWG